MLGFYSDGDTCWNCRYFECVFLKHKGRCINNQWDYHRQYTCNKKRISFWNGSGIVRDGSCGCFWSGANSARSDYGCVIPKGNSFIYSSIRGYGGERI